jgi:hypothetical protein
MTTLRRAVTVPAVIILEILILIYAPLLLVAAGLVAAGTGSRRPVRSTALVVAYAGIELSTLRRLIRRDEPDWHAVLRDVLARAYAAVKAILDVRLVLEDGSTTGFAPDGRGRPWWRLPVHRELIVRTVLAPAATVPRDRETLAGWLDDAWAQVDSWVHSHAAPPADQVT